MLLQLIILTATAQTPIENGNMETWIFDNDGNYYEPAPFKYWTTVNPVSKLSPLSPVTTYQETQDVHSGTSAVKLVTGSFVGLIISGICATGYFDNTVIDPSKALKQGIPFTERPTSFKGFYKFAPINNDSAAISIQFVKFNTQTQKPDTIGKAALVVYQSTANYVEFNLPINYSSPEKPDTMMIVFASSAGGNDFKGAVGTTLYIDDVSLDYETGINIPLMPEININISPNPVANFITLTSNQNLPHAIIKIYTLNGKLVLTQPLNTIKTAINTTHLANGSYLYQILSDTNNLINGGKFQVLK